MKHKNILLSGFLYGLSSLVAVLLIASVASGISGGDLFKGSVLSLFNKIGLTDYDEARPDVGIEYVTLRKISNPSAEFDYYKYQATVVVRNYGELLKDGSVVISSGDGQKTAFVRNTLNGLSLGKGETFIFDDYEIILGGKNNYGSFEFEIDLKDQKERSLENNRYALDVFEMPVKIESLEVASVSDGEINFGYTITPGYEDAVDEIEICLVEEGDVFNGEDLKYAEVLAGDTVFSYYKLKADKDLWLLTDFECEEFSGTSFKFDAEKKYSLYLRADDGEDKFAASNFLYIPAQNVINRAEFTKLFTEYAGLGLEKDGKIYYEDVLEDAWYFPYVQTMFNYGLLEDNAEFTFLPAENIKRQEILEPLLNYFDVDLSVDEGAPHFHDVPKDHEEFFFAESLYSSGKAKTLGIYFHPDMPVSSYFLKYLIDEYLST